jgi:glycosyltransferase involved in cell wall biosynthesis
MAFEPPRPETAREPRRKPRVLFAANTSWYLYNYYRNVFRAFLDAGVEVLVASPSDGHSEKLRALGCIPVALPLLPASKNPLREAATLAGFLRLYHARRPDMVFHFTIKCNLYGSLAATALGIPHVNGISGLGSAFNNEGPLRFAARWAYRIAQRRTHKVFFQNAYDLEFMLREKMVRAERAVLLPGSGVNLDSFVPSHRPRAEEFVFVFAGRMLWEKGLLYLAEAMRLLRREEPRTRCLAFGFLDPGNPKYVDQEQLAAWEAEGVLVYGGPLEDVKQAYRQADCVILPTYYREGVPKSLLEAAAMAKPILATDLPGCRQAVIDGENGLLCAPRDTGALAHAMLRMVRMPEAERRRLGDNGRRRVETSFGESRVIDQYLKTARGLLGL